MWTRDRVCDSCRSRAQAARQLAALALRRPVSLEEASAQAAARTPRARHLPADPGSGHTQSRGPLPVRRPGPQGKAGSEGQQAAASPGAVPPPASPASRRLLSRHAFSSTLGSLEEALGECPDSQTVTGVPRKVWADRSPQA